MLYTTSILFINNLVLKSCSITELTNSPNNSRVVCPFKESKTLTDFNLYIALAGVVSCSLGVVDKTVTLMYNLTIISTTTLMMFTYHNVLLQDVQSWYLIKTDSVIKAVNRWKIPPKSPMPP